MLVWGYFTSVLSVRHTDLRVSLRHIVVFAAMGWLEFSPGIQLDLYGRRLAGFARLHEGLT
jgi:hypothetical protein